MMDAHVSLFRRADIIKPVDHPTLAAVIDDIRKGRWAAGVEAVRTAGDKDAKDRAKLRLPAVTFGGKFSNRRNDALLTPSGYVQLDYDGVQDVDRRKALLMEDPHVAAVFRTASGAGLRVLVPVTPAPQNDEQYKQAFAAVRELFHEADLDESTKDIARLSFVSVDPDLYINENARPVRVTYREPVHTNGVHVSLNGSAPGVEAVREVLRYVPSRPNHDDWIKVISAVLDGVDGDIDTAEALLKEWSPEEQPGEYRYKLEHSLSRVGFGTLVYNARQNGYQRTVSTQDVIELYRLDERGDAKLYAKQSRGQRLYNHDSKRFAFYRAGIWEEDDTLQVRNEIPERCRALYLNASNELDKEIVEIKREGGDPEKIKDKESLRDGLRKRADQLNRLSRIKHVAELAASEMPSKATDFDRDPYLYNTLNGTIDLRGPSFRDHDAKDRITKRAGVLYDAGASCPRFDRFVHQICDGNADLVRYLQIISGYLLTGLTDLDLLFFFYGTGANGKSTFIAVLEMLQGDYFRSIPIETLLSKRYNATDEYHIAKLHGVRCCVASEIPQGRRLNESLVKDLTGGDHLTGRVPYGEPFNFKPSHKLIIVGNHKPVVRGTDEGIWRRIRLIPFTVRIPKSEQVDRSVLLAEFRRELPGILNWAVEGYRIYQAEGLEAPDAVTSATKDFKDESDVLGGFLGENCVEASHAKAVAKTLYAHYAGWCEQANEHAMKYREFTAALRERGFTVEPGTGNRTEVKGIGLGAELGS